MCNCIYLYYIYVEKKPVTLCLIDCVREHKVHLGIGQALGVLGALGGGPLTPTLFIFTFF